MPPRPWLPWATANWSRGRSCARRLGSGQNQVPRERSQGACDAVLRGAGGWVSVAPLRRRLGQLTSTTCRRGHAEAGPSAERGGGGGGGGELCIRKRINVYPTPSRRKGHREKVLRVRKRGPAPDLMVSAYSSNHWEPGLLIPEPGRQTFIAWLIVRWGHAHHPHACL